MLSKKYKAIKRFLSAVSKIGPINRKLVVLSKMYMDIDRGYRFSYVADENGETSFLDTLARHYGSKNFTFFDVGAHVGSYTDMILERVKTYRGYLFDLSHQTLALCINRHGKNKNLTINHVGLSDTSGKVEYRFYPKAQLQNGIVGVGPYIGLDFQVHTADCTTGDDYCTKNNISHIDLLKIDTEGYDLHVLRGFSTMLDRAAIDVIQFEYNIKSGETHSMMSDFYKYLESKGYLIGVLRIEGVIFKPYDFYMNDFNSGPNYIACLPTMVPVLSRFGS